MGAWVRAARKHKGWTQTELGERMNVTKASVSQWERDKTRASHETLLRIKRLTGYPLHDTLPTEDWPLPLVSPEILRSLPADHLQLAQAHLLGFMAGLGVVDPLPSFEAAMKRKPRSRTP